MASTTAKIRRPRRRSLGYRVGRVGLKALIVVLLVGVIVPPLAGAIGFSTLLFLPLPGSIPEEREAVEALPSYVFDSTGRQIAVFREFDLTVPTQPEDIPEVMINAVVAAEDRRFWEHNGVDVNGVARAAQENLDARGIVQGGSTITQQYVKNQFLSSERTFDRKIREAILATKLEREMTKDEIMFGYLDTAYFGSGAYGVGAAAKSYFDKPVADLTLSEAALLAGIIPAPTKWSPRNNPLEADFRRRVVLDSMLDAGYITTEEHSKARPMTVWPADRGEPFGPATVIVSTLAKGATDLHYFVDYVEQELLDRIGPEQLYRGGLRIDTTLDLELQEMAEETIASRLKGTESPLEMSLVTVDPKTGWVVAMVAGRDYEKSQVNLATGGSTGFQPGSSFKPIVLAEAFRQGISPYSKYDAPGIWDVPNCADERCTISNAGGGGYGSVDLYTATHKSINTVFGQLIVDVGTTETAQLAHDMGITRITPDRRYGVSLSLGAYEVSPLDMAASYAVLVNRGIRKDVTGVSMVTDSNGDVVLDHVNRVGTQVLPEAVADTVVDTMRGVIDGGTGKRASIGRPAAGKTGTAQDERAAWFVGVTPQYATSVWMGYSDSNRPLRNIRGVGKVQGGTHPAIAWGNFMRKAHAELDVISFPEPGPLPRPLSEEEFEPGTGQGRLTPQDTLPDIRLGGRSPIRVTPKDCDGDCVQHSEQVIRTTTTTQAPRVSSSGSSSPTTTRAAPATTAPATTTTSPPASSSASNSDG